ncbi:dihydrolipoyl dehydrogenase family protein [Halorarum salinum]|uniref:Dihydrolipoyl dehydrogenase n=1 Tax=Halorarum salinum TaxID=2743089 RepID=A0A7D5Q8V4_9EURY|nr:dihydrolipoyl dehydrogenase [Halobaculum salinum]QLG61217.1 dihydrolipoyl dehydrogenase [Halobaculum salinum]
MTHFDLVVLGGGTGNLVAAEGAAAGLDVALVERGPLGGTCLNRGCNPSKKLIHHANVVETVRNAGAFGVDVDLNDVAFADIVDDVTETITEEAESKAADARATENLTLYRKEARFVDERTVEVDAGSGDGGDGTAGGDGNGGEEITGEAIVLAGGSRPMIPDSIDGTGDVAFLTSDEALRLEELPDKLVIVGGGYIAVEMAHFFGGMGSEVVVVGRGDVLADREDRDVAERLTDAYADRHELHLGHEVTALAEGDGEGTGRTVVRAESGDGDELEVRGDEVLVATGRRPNSDTWNVEAAGIETDGKGFVETNEYLETSAEGVWAIGDVAGNYMFKHSGDKEAEYVVENVVRGNRTAVEYPGMAHAIFGSPEVGSLGRTESELEDGREYEVGTYTYDETALGVALNADAGFAKAIVGADGEVLGFHVVGPHASMLVHEVSTAVAAGADAERIAETIHVHPALSEVVQGAFRDVYDVAPWGV